MTPPTPQLPPLPSLEILFLILGPPWASDRKKGQSMTTSRQKRRGGEVMCDTLSVSLMLKHWSFKCQSNFFILMQIVKIMWTCPCFTNNNFHKWKFLPLKTSLALNCRNLQAHLGSLAFLKIDEKNVWGVVLFKILDQLPNPTFLLLDLHNHEKNFPLDLKYLPLLP